MVSVCIATYNGEKYIRQQLDSILPQIGEQDEVVVSDDGSTDSTLDIIKKYNDERIRILHHENKDVVTTFPLDRPTHNFEYALSNAKGDIIFLSDQDDVWLEGKVEKVLGALQSADLVIHDTMVVDEGLNVIAESYFERVGVHQGVIPNAVRSTYLGCCMAMKRCVLERAMPFPKTKVGHDLWLGIVADMKYKTFILREPLLMYRKHSNSVTPSGTPSNYSIWFKINYRLTVFYHIIRLILK